MAMTFSRYFSRQEGELADFRWGVFDMSDLERVLFGTALFVCCSFFQPTQASDRSLNVEQIGSISNVDMNYFYLGEDYTDKYIIFDLHNRNEEDIEVSTVLPALRLAGSPSIPVGHCQAMESRGEKLLEGLISTGSRHAETWYPAYRLGSSLESTARIEPNGRLVRIVVIPRAWWRNFDCDFVADFGFGTPSDREWTEMRVHVPRMEPARPELTTIGAGRSIEAFAEIVEDSPWVGFHRLLFLNLFLHADERPSRQLHLHSTESICPERVDEGEFIFNPFVYGDRYLDLGTRVLRPGELKFFRFSYALKKDAFDAIKDCTIRVNFSYSVAHVEGDIEAFEFDLGEIPFSYTKPRN